MDNLEMGSMMINHQDVRWKNIYDFIFKCGKTHNPRSFAIEILKNIGRLCSFDQGLVFFIDGNRNISGQYLMNIEKSWTSMYIGYYANTENKRFSYNKDIKEDPNKITLNVLDWENESSTEFIPNYIRPRGLKYSCGFGLFDLYGNYRTIISLDRVERKDFSHDELMNLYLAIPLLNNLHKNFYYRGSSLNAITQATREASSLTAREAEIANLLCKGISPTNISHTLHIAPSTTNKHISHIYEKLQVSSQQELLVCLLSQPG